MTNAADPENEDMVDLGSDFMLTAKKVEMIVSALLWFNDTWKYLPAKQREQLDELLDQFKFIYTVMSDHSSLEDIYEQIFEGTK